MLDFWVEKVEKKLKNKFSTVVFNVYFFVGNHVCLSLHNYENVSSSQSSNDILNALLHVFLNNYITFIQFTIFNLSILDTQWYSEIQSPESEFRKNKFPQEFWIHGKRNSVQQGQLLQTLRSTLNKYFS